jgi:hypothetical protein
MNNNHSTINYNDCNFHDFSATAPSNDPECDRQTKTNSQNLIIPTETEVWQFLQDECKLDISQISIRPPFDEWWNILHEGSHYATKPPSYLTLWRENGSPGEVPNLDWLSGDGLIKPKDPTPDEWGCRAWCLEVLKYKGWKNPLDCPEYPRDWEGYQTHNPRLWMLNNTTSPSHPFQKKGFEQLKSVGIDVNHGIFRPTKEIKILGLQPIFGWDFPQSA